jgi:hypothetical protein
MNKNKNKSTEHNPWNQVTNIVAVIGAALATLDFGTEMRIPHRSKRFHPYMCLLVYCEHDCTLSRYFSMNEMSLTIFKVKLCQYVQYEIGPYG